MAALSQLLLAPPAVFVWAAALGVVTIRQLGKLGQARGEHWWHHCTHFLMLVGMVVMYASIGLGGGWFDRRVWIVVYGVTTLAILLWMILRYRRRGAVGDLWALAFIQQTAMIYMCAPMRQWVPLLTYAFILYFVWESYGWLGRIFVARDHGGAATLPRRRLDPEALCMAIMAVSMGYMFVGMQLKLSERGAAPVAAPAPAESDVAPAAVATPAEATPGQDGAAAAPAPDARLYTIAAGDTLSRIAGRLYGDPRRWKEVLDANPGLDPRRLHAGQRIHAPP
jgi:hypothetical protein